MKTRSYRRRTCAETSQKVRRAQESQFPVGQIAICQREASEIATAALGALGDLRRRRELRSTHILTSWTPSCFSSRSDFLIIYRKFFAWQGGDGFSLRRSEGVVLCRIGNATRAYRMLLANGAKAVILDGIYVRERPRIASGADHLSDIATSMKSNSGRLQHEEPPT